MALTTEPRARVTLSPDDETLELSTTPVRRPRVARRDVLPAVVLFGLSLLLGSYRLGETIDINSDEATYTIESVSLYQTGLTQWNGAPFFVHPPLFYMVEGAYFAARGI
ncbi:MAG TPA: hypothetical protein VM536_01175, partial [Chloroflexia bacterium]|nr:hypothetical protein [Chloroflexia bacterium]